MAYPYLKGKIALVTGGSRGIGAATADALAKQCANVVLTYRNKAARAEEVAEQVRSHGVQAMTMAVDLTVREDVDALMDAIKKEFGHLDVLVLNASGGME
ncbi:MAG: SDR family NAD(P)-dependent oxidoreductase [Chloroflexia bacterium]